MSSHNNIHMRSVPYQSHMHIDTSSIKIIQLYVMHAYAQAYAHHHVPFSLWGQLCSRRLAISTGSRHPVSRYAWANSAVGALPSLLGAITLFLVMQEANSAVRGLPSLPGVVTPFLVMQEANSAVGGLPSLPGAVIPFLLHCSCYDHAHDNKTLNSYYHISYPEHHIILP
jgi:hypothetical protein